MAEISAIVLVGGLGTRLRPVTYTVPKQLIPIAGQCALYHAFDVLPPSVGKIGLACGYKAEEIELYLKRHPYPTPVEVVREETPLGTGGGMKNAERFATDPFVLLNGDVVSGVDVEAMLSLLEERKAFGVMSLYKVDDTSPYGVAELDPEGRIQRFVEKPPKDQSPSPWINAGAGVWRRDVLSAIPAGKVVSFEREIVPDILPKGVYGFCFKNWWEDAGTPERVLNAQRLLFDHPDRRRTPWTTPEGKDVHPPVAVGKDCQVVGRKVGPYVTLGDGVILEEGCIVEDSILMDGVRVGKGAMVVHSILGPGYAVPPETIVEKECRALENGPASDWRHP
ncbi:MAG: NDP-sugar synthase [Candidatus Thermoplasmatota archaeon]|jgi:mannose-1-phosphate guanylyltransferase|nr:NDP-sugar synthase [Candidatus Thermoplasmatota archaeon]MCL5984551.1 NDP-sugar synthase [Candidatus Thermoplasmatota archaeon]